MEWRLAKCYVSKKSKGDSRIVSDDENDELDGTESDQLWDSERRSPFLNSRIYIYNYRGKSTLFTVRNSERGWRDNGQSSWTPPRLMGKWTLIWKVCVPVCTYCHITL